MNLQPDSKAVAQMPFRVTAFFLKKKPSTSEVLDWLKLLLAEDLTAEDLRRDGVNALPRLHGALLKNEQDVHLFERLAFMTRAQR